MEGVATTRAIFACLVVAIGLCLACSLARVARDTLFLQFSAGLGPSIAPLVPAESADSSASFSLSFCVPSSFSVPC